MNAFSKYLVDCGFALSTIQQHVRFTDFFLEWLSNNTITPHGCRYPEIVRLIDDGLCYYASRQNPRKTVNRLMVAISQYFDFLITEDPNLKNPAKHIRIKSQEVKMVSNLIELSDLQDLYHSVQAIDARSIRNKVMFGLLVFQGLSVRDLHRLSLDDLRLRKGSVFIRGDHERHRKNGSTPRELELEALQIIDILDYANNIRPRILAGSYRHLPGRKPDQQNIVFHTNQLLLSISGSLNLKNSLHHLFRNLKTTNSKIKTASQIRQSVIAHWLKSENLRQVQYMAGHRYVSSTEYYKQINLDELRREICEHHPLV